MSPITMPQWSIFIRTSIGFMPSNEIISRRAFYPVTLLNQSEFQPSATLTFRVQHGRLHYGLACSWFQNRHDIPTGICP
jgi:hypothetical protein